MFVPNSTPYRTPAPHVYACGNGHLHHASREGTSCYAGSKCGSVCTPAEYAWRTIRLVFMPTWLEGGTYE